MEQVLDAYKIARAKQELQEREVAWARGSHQLLARSVSPGHRRQVLTLARPGRGVVVALAHDHATKPERPTAILATTRHDFHQLISFFSPLCRMGNSQSTKEATSSPLPAACAAASTPSAQSDACPVAPEYRNSAIYNVYGQRTNDPNAPAPTSNPLAALQGSELMDPTNYMPLEPNQQPCPGQRKPLSVDRAVSIIPKGGTTGSWLFPSPQMVFNALKRKGKGDDVTEDDMDGFIAAHNAMNEVTWQRVVVWEKLHASECSTPTLLRFQGRPHDLSPLAWIRSILGGPAPFDRHDWTLDRCGREVRYVIDFYYYDDKAGTPGAFEIVARPAADSLDAILDRTKLAIYIKFAEWGLPCPISGTSGEVGKTAASTSGEVGKTAASISATANSSSYALMGKTAASMIATASSSS
eukprot:gene18269-24722_t